MRSILLTAILASVGSASFLSQFKNSNVATPFDFGIPPEIGFAKAYYNFNLVYGIENSIDQGDQEGIIDAWI